MSQLTLKIAFLCCVAIISVQPSSALSSPDNQSSSPQDPDTLILSEAIDLFDEGQYGAALPKLRTAYTNLSLETEFVRRNLILNYIIQTERALASEQATERTAKAQQRALAPADNLSNPTFQLPGVLCPGATLDESLSTPELRRYAGARINAADHLTRAALYADASRGYCEALVTADHLRDYAAISHVLLRLGEVNHKAGQDASTVAAYENAIDLFQQIGYLGDAAGALTALGDHYRSTDRPVEAIATYQLAIEQYRDLNDTFNRANTRIQLSKAYAAAGDDEEAELALKEALSEYELLGDSRRSAMTLEDLGLFNLKRNQPQSAVDYFEEAIELRRLEPNPAAVVLLLTQKATAHSQMGDALQVSAAEVEVREVIAAQQDAGKKGNLLHLLGIYLKDSQRYDDAIETLGSALVLRREVGDDLDTARTLVMMGQSFGQLDRIDEAIQYVEESVELYRLAGDEENFAFALETLGELYSSVEMDEQAIPVFEQALQIRRETGHTERIARGLASLGKSYQRLGREDEVNVLYQEANQLVAELGNSPADILALESIGRLYLSVERYTDAISLWKDVVAIRRDLDNDEFTADALLSLGHAHAKAELGGAALAAYQEASQLYDTLNIAHKNALALTSMGNLHSKAEQYTDAIVAWKEALEIHQDLGNTAGVANTLIPLGGAYRKTGREQAAIASYAMAGELYESLDNIAGKITALEALGRLYHSAERYEEAVRIRQQTLGTALSLADDASIAEAILHLADSYRKAGQEQEAIEAYALAIDLFGSLDDVIGEIRALEALGYLHHAAERFDEAIRIREDVLQMAHDLADDALIANANLLLADSYRKSGQDKTAIEAYSVASQLYDDMGDLANKLQAMNGLVRLYHVAERYDDAIQLGEQSLLLARDLEDERLIANSSMSLADSLRKLERHADATALYERAAELYSDMEDVASYLLAREALGRLYHGAEQYDDAIAIWNELLTVGREVGGDVRFADLSVLRADSWRKSGNVQEAVEDYQEAIRIFDLAEIPAKRVVAIEAMGGLYVAEEQYEVAIPLLQEAIDIRRSLDDNYATAVTLHRLGKAHQGLGQPELALTNYTDAIASFEEVGDTEGVATIWESIARLKRDQNLIEDAIAAYGEAQTLWEQLGNEEQLLRNLSSVGSVYRSIGQIGSARLQYNDALALAREVGAKADEAQILIKLGDLYRSDLSFAQSLQFYNLSLDLWRQLDQNDQLVLTRLKIATVYRAQQNDADALATYNLALSAALNSSDQTIAAAVYSAMGSYYKGLDRYPDAEQAYKSALVMWQRAADPERAQRERENVWKMLQVQGLHEEAMRYSGNLVGLSQPYDGSVVSGLVDLIGMAAHPAFLKYQIDLLITGDEDQAMGVELRKTPVWGRIGTLDTLAYPDGEHLLRLRVVRQDWNYDEYYSRIIIANPPGSRVSVDYTLDNGITAPASGATLSGNTTVSGIAQLPPDNWEKWQLDLLLFGEERRATNLRVSSSIANGPLYQLDTRDYPDGEHVLRLRVVRTDHNYDEFYTRITINN